MAQVIPDRIPKISTAGEKLLFNTLKEHLPDEYIVYYEPEINGRRPDFVIIGPTLGILVLEVKDYIFKYFPRYVIVEPKESLEPKKEETSILTRIKSLFK